MHLFGKQRMLTSRNNTPPPRQELLSRLSQNIQLGKASILEEKKHNLKNIFPTEVVETVTSLDTAKDLEFIGEYYKKQSLSTDEKVRLGSYIKSMLTVDENVSSQVYNLLYKILERHEVI